MSNDIDVVHDKIKKGLDEIATPSWQSEGISTTEYATELKNNLESIVKDGLKDKDLVKKTFSDALSFLTWVAVKKEIHTTKAMLQAQIVREKQNGRAKRSIKTK